MTKRFLAALVLVLAMMPVVPPAVAAEPGPGADVVVAGFAPADQLLLRTTGPDFGRSGATNLLLVQLVNAAPLQGLQFSISYDPSVARPVAVTGLGRLHDPLELHYQVASGTIGALAYDATPGATSIPPGDAPIVSVAFAVLDSVADTLGVTVHDGLAVTESLKAHGIEGQSIRIPVTGAARSASSTRRTAGGQGPAGWSDSRDLAVTRFALYPAGPSPFFTGTTLGFDLPRPAPVRIAVYDVRGRLVRVLIDRASRAGRHSVHWDGTAIDGARAGPGLFFVRMVAEDFACSRKVVAVQ